MKITGTKVTSVQIYRSGAEVVRQGVMEVPEGVSRIRIGGLSWDANLETTRLFVPEEITLSDIRFVSAEDGDEKPSDALEQKITALKAALKIREMQADMWEKNGDFSSCANLNIRDIEAYIENLPGRLENLFEEVRRLNLAIEEKEKELAQEKEREKLPVMAVELCAARAGSFPFEIHCFEANASWLPVYEIHTNAKDPITLRVRARILQNSPYDWEQVKVSLLTGRPSGGSAPSQKPVYLEIQPELPPPAPKMNSPMMGAFAMSMQAAAPMVDGAAAGDTLRLARAETASAEVSSEETMTEYLLPSLKDIPTSRNGLSEGTLADLQTFEVPAEYETLLIPKQDVRGYLTANIRTRDIPDTVRGSAAIYLKGIYTGEARISPDLSQDMVTVSLGEEESVRGMRIEKTKKASQAMLKNTQSTEYLFEIKVRNGKNQALLLSVKDQIPVSRDKTITVDVLNLSHGELEEATGLIKWQLSLAPGETRTLQLAYRVNWPKDKKIKETFSASASIGGRSFCKSCGAEVFGRFCPECGAVID